MSRNSKIFAFKFSQLSGSEVMEEVLSAMRTDQKKFTF